MTHTQGRWAWQAQEDGCFGVVVVKPGHADCRLATLGNVNGEADARLMAAAPDLLRACQEALTLLRTRDIGPEYFQPLLQTAISKATGGPS